MTASQKLILALDVPDFAAAKKMIDYLDDEVSFYKIGLELLMSGDYFKLISYLKDKNKKVFCDLKLYDISETVGRAVKNISQYDVDILTIHAASRGIMEQAVQNKGKMQVIAVTILTNLEQKDLNEMGFDAKISLQDLAIKKTKLALDSGLDGIVASALEAPTLRQNFGNDFLIVSPGIRLETIANDDQKRVCDVKTALFNGASHLVVGRPITRAENPKAAAQQFNLMINESSRNPR